MHSSHTVAQNLTGTICPPQTSYKEPPCTTCPTGSSQALCTDCVWSTTRLRRDCEDALEHSCSPNMGFPVHVF